MSVLEISHKSCKSIVLFGDRIASIQGIMSDDPGKGHATQCIKKIEIIARNKKIREIWFPTVLSPILEKLLIKFGFEFTNFGPHPEMPDDGDVTGYKKVLGVKK